MNKFFPLLLTLIFIITACGEPPLPPTATRQPTDIPPTNTAIPTDLPATATQEPTSQPTAEPTIEPTATAEPTPDQLPGGGFTYDMPAGYLLNPAVGPTGQQAGNGQSILLGKENATDFGPFVRVSGGVLQEPFSAEALLSYYQNLYDMEYRLDISETVPITTANGLSGSQFTFTFTVPPEKVGTGQLTLLATDEQFVTLAAIADAEAWEGAFSAEVATLIDSITFTHVSPDLPEVAATAFLSETTIIPQPYSLGWTTLTLPDEATAIISDTLHSRPAKIEGIIAVPEGEGEHPVALVLHGRFANVCQPLPGSYSAPAAGALSFCLPGSAETRYDVGFANLVGALAEEGYIALSINVNDAYQVSQAGMQQFNDNILDQYFVPQLAQLHLDALANDTLPVALTGRVDLSQPPLLIGHSRGGQNVVKMAQSQSSQGLLLFGAVGAGGFSVPSNVPLGIVYGECDGDVATWESQRYFEEAENDPNRSAFASSVLLVDANHNYFDGLIGIRDDSGRKLNSTKCAMPDNGLSRAEQQAFMVAYVRDFVAQLRGEMIFSVERPAPDQLYGFSVITNLTTADKQTLLTNEGGASRLTVSPCSAGEVCHPTIMAPEFVIPGRPTAQRLSWQQPNASYTLSFDPADATVYDALNLRLVLDPTSALNNESAVITYTVIPRDVFGNSMTITTTTTPLLTTEPHERFGFGGVPILAGANRLPLDGIDGVDFTQLEAIMLQFPQERGELLLFDVSLLSDGFSRLLEEDVGLRGIGRIALSSSCTATLIDINADASTAYAITNGHCIEWLTNGAIVNRADVAGDVIFNYFADTQDAQIRVPIVEVVYSTMQGSDVAIVRLDATISELREQGVEPLTIADAPLEATQLRVIGAPTNSLSPEEAFLRAEDCVVTGRADLLEFNWHFYDTYRTNCQDIFGGSSGSPVFSADENVIYALINTTVEGESACYLGVPCEISESGVSLNLSSSYATPIDGLGNCFDESGEFALMDNCPLPPVAQLTIEGNPANASQPPLGWNSTITGTLSYYRYKTGSVGDTNCRVEDGYSDPIALADNALIDDAIADAEGFYLLCVLAGESETVDETWQSLDHPTVVFAQIDTTPPDAPVIDVLESHDAYRITLVFQPPELSDYWFKFGSAETTNCADQSDYQRYRRIPISIERGNEPIRLCVIASDNADNETEPLDVLLNEP